MGKEGEDEQEPDVASDWTQLVLSTVENVNRGSATGEHSRSLWSPEGVGHLSLWPGTQKDPALAAATKMQVSGTNRTWRHLEQDNQVLGGRDQSTLHLPTINIPVSTRWLRMEFFTTLISAH